MCKRSLLFIELFEKYDAACWSVRSFHPFISDGNCSMRRTWRKERMAMIYLRPWYCCCWYKALLFLFHFSPHPLHKSSLSSLLSAHFQHHTIPLSPHSYQPTTQLYVRFHPYSDGKKKKRKKEMHGWLL